MRFVVATDDDGDVALGFDGYPWHTHADILAAVAGVVETDAVEQFVQDLLGNRAVIAISRVGGVIRDVWVTDDPSAEFRHLTEGESIELRLWHGKINLED